MLWEDNACETSQADPSQQRDYPSGRALLSVDSMLLKLKLARTLGLCPSKDLQAWDCVDD